MSAWASWFLVLLYLGVQLRALPMVGLTDDDDFYISAGIAYAEWLGRAFGPGEAWSRAEIDRAFTHNHEHPPLAKYAFGLCHFVFRGWLGPIDAARVGTVLFSTLLAWVLLWMARQHLGHRRGLIAGGTAVLLLLTLPRFFFHSHVATLDVPVASLYVLAAALALKAERAAWAAWAAGAAFGLACATKLNAPFLVVPYVLFAVLVRYRRSRGADEVATSPLAGTLRLPAVPLALVAMAIMAPVVFVGTWPWLWHDTFTRLGEYVGFHLNHYGIHFLYFGTVFHQNPFAPWHAPFVMAFVTVPLATSALAGFGIAAAACRVRNRLRDRTGPDSPERREADLVLTAFLHALFAVLVVALSGGPKYGGAKLFMPFFPFWCLLAGYGVLRLLELAGDRLGLRGAAVGVFGLALVSQVGLQNKFGGYALSQYNASVNGLAGATARGFERQYYDVAFPDLVAWLNEAGPDDLKVHFLPNNWEYVRTYRWYRRAGALRSDIKVVRDVRDADWLVLTHERRFARYRNDLLVYRTRPVLREHRLDGVPLWTVLDLER